MRSWACEWRVRWLPVRVPVPAQAQVQVPYRNLPCRDPLRRLNLATSACVSHSLSLSPSHMSTNTSNQPVVPTRHTCVAIEQRRFLPQRSLAVPRSRCPVPGAQFPVPGSDSESPLHAPSMPRSPISSAACTRERGLRRPRASTERPRRDVPIRHPQETCRSATPRGPLHFAAVVGPPACRTLFCIGVRHDASKRLADGCRQSGFSAMSVLPQTGTIIALLGPLASPVARPLCSPVD